MGLLNPLQVFILPFVFLFAFPLALCAGFTTILAFLILFLRLFLVYFDVGLEWLRYTVLGRGPRTQYIPSPSASRRPSPPTSPFSTLSFPSSPEASTSSRSRQKTKRPASVCSESTSPLTGLDGLALTPGASLDRDFEGIGGWRLGDREDTTWASLNSRLEMPDHHRHHYRASSGGAVMSGTNGIGIYAKTGTRRGSTSPEDLRFVSPNSSRSRTPTRIRMDAFTSLDHDGYFPPYTSPPVARKIRV